MNRGLRNRYDARLELQHYQLVATIALAAGSVMALTSLERGAPLVGAVLVGAMTSIDVATIAWFFVSVTLSRRAVERFWADRGLGPGGPWRLLLGALAGYRSRRRSAASSRPPLPPRSY